MRPGALALVSGSAIVLVAGATAADPPAGWERGLARTVVRLPDALRPPLEVVMQAGNRLVAALVVLAVLLAGQHRLAARLAVAATVAWLVATVAKELVDRSRPTSGTLGAPVRVVVEGPGLPSSHTAVATALAVVLLSRATGYPRALAAVALVAAAGTAVARVFIGAHWPLDVVAGAGAGLVGAGVATLGLPARERGA